MQPQWWLLLGCCAWASNTRGCNTGAIPPALAPLALAAAASRVEYFLTAGQSIPSAVNPLQSKQVRLNGRPLALLPGPALPALEGRTVDNSAPLRLPPASVGFVSFPAVVAPACR